MALNDYETEYFHQAHTYGVAGLDIDDGTYQGSAKIITSNYPYAMEIKAGYSELENCEEDTAQHIQVLFDTAFPHECIAVIASPVVDYTSNNYMHNAIVTRKTASGFKCVYKYENTSGQFTSSTEYGHICWIAFGY